MSAGTGSKSERQNQKLEAALSRQKPIATLKKEFVSLCTEKADHARIQDTRFAKARK
jgi:hypothetical protein